MAALSVTNNNANIYSNYVNSTQYTLKSKKQALKFLSSFKAKQIPLPDGFTIDNVPVKKLQATPFSDIMSNSVTFQFSDTDSAYSATVLPSSGQIKAQFSSPNLATEVINIFNTAKSDTSLYLWGELESDTGIGKDALLQVLPFISDADIQNLLISERQMWVCEITNFDFSAKTVTSTSTYNCFRVAYDLFINNQQPTNVVQPEVIKAFKAYWEFKLNKDPNGTISSAFGGYILPNAGNGTNGNNGVRQVLNEYFGENYDPFTSTNLDKEYENLNKYGNIFDLHCAYLVQGPLNTF